MSASKKTKKTSGIIEDGQKLKLAKTFLGFSKRVFEALERCRLTNYYEINKIFL